MSDNKQLAVAEQTTTALATTSNVAAIMEEAGISMSDIVIPKILLMQGTSGIVAEDKAKLGDMVRSDSEEVIGGIASPLEILPLKLNKVWRTYDVSGASPKFLRAEPVTKINEKREWTGEENGIPIRHDMCFDFFVLLKKECEEGTPFPYVLSFKRTSAGTGKELASHIFKLGLVGQLPYARSVQIRTEKQKNPNGSNYFAVYKIKPTDAVPQFKEAAAMWFGILKDSSKYTVDEAAEEKAEEKPAAPVKKAKVIGDVVEQF